MFIEKVEAAIEDAGIHNGDKISFDSMVGSGGSVLGQSGLGYLAKVQGIGSGFVVGGIGTILVAPIIYAVRKLGGDADHIESDKHEKSGATAGEGIPEVAGVDTSTQRE